MRNETQAWHTIGKEVLLVCLGALLATVGALAVNLKTEKEPSLYYRKTKQIACSPPPEAPPDGPGNGQSAEGEKATGDGQSPEGGTGAEATVQVDVAERVVGTVELGNAGDGDAQEWSAQLVFPAGSALELYGVSPDTIDPADLSYSPGHRPRLSFGSSSGLPHLNQGDTLTIVYVLDRRGDVAVDFKCRGSTAVPRPVASGPGVPWYLLVLAALAPVVLYVAWWAIGRIRYQLSLSAPTDSAVTRQERTGGVGRAGPEPVGGDVPEEPDG